jgi:hypothetical protein
MNEKIWPTSGLEKLTKPQIERHGAGSEPHFHEADPGGLNCLQNRPRANTPG